MLNRRNFLKKFTGLLPASVTFPLLKGGCAGTKSTVGRDYFKEIGVKPHFR